MRGQAATVCPRLRGELRYVSVLPTVMGKFHLAPEYWPILNRLLDEALDLPQPAREEWLARLPEEHAALKPLLRRLLARASTLLSGSFLESLPPVDRNSASDDTLPDPVEGDLIGPWRLIRKLGEGGMASVWLANRADGVFDRTVALKLPHPGLWQDALSERLSREQHILAALNHPHIARLLDAGISSAGQPFLAIEYVEGQHIDTYCRERNLGVRGRLGLFLQITRALAHAHGMLIVHRDLKPANILVTPEGDVRLLDFGIAKLLEDGKTRETHLTRFSGRALTLDYASPEQVSGSPVTVASDVYSLGVVLYELLTDTRPYQLKRDSRAALEEAILDIEARPPSEAAGDPALSKTLRGDLDTILLKSLKKDPAARYSTIEAFAEDVHRYLQNRPVLARPDRAAYRFSKFVRRHRVAVAGGAVAAVLVIAGCVLAAWQAHIAIAQRHRAEEVKSFLVSVLLDAHTYWAGRPLSALDLLRRANARIDQLKGADAATRLELLNILGASLLSLQDTTTAEAVLRNALRESARIGGTHPQALRARMLWLWVRIFRGQYTEARPEVDLLLRDMQAHPGPLPEDLAAALRVRSELAWEEGNAAEAESFAQRALDLAERRLGPHHNQSVLALVSLSLARQLRAEARQAVETGQLALRRGLEAYGGHANHPNVLKARIAYGQALAAAGRLKEGMEEVAAAIRGGSETFGPSSRGVGLDLRILARLQWKSGDLESALESADRSVRILKEHLDPEAAGYGALLGLRGGILLAAGRSEEALPDLERAEQIAVRSYGPLHPKAREASALRASALTGASLRR